MHNIGKLSGGAIHGDEIYIENNKGPITFENNRAFSGGAVYTKSLLIAGNHDLLFLNNFGAYNGGAIRPLSCNSKLELSADYGDIIFSGNHNSIPKAKLNSIYMEQDIQKFSIGARKNHSVIFYDPIVTERGKGSLLLNPDEQHLGSIVFSGKRLKENEKKIQDNRASTICQNISLFRGILQLEAGATLSACSFDQKGGSIIISPGSSLKTTNSEQGFIISTTCALSPQTLHPPSLSLQDVMKA